MKMKQRDNEKIMSALFDLCVGQIDWKCQCPPERRGAKIAILWMLGFSWEKASTVAFENPCVDDLKKIVEKHRRSK